ncbi:MAG: PAS domain-containing sensor histidine kinase [Desulfomonilaceae bacterium]|nr:PAS domain-containing sensor histidine kinase [Desulfomonilaceae bacterium]
MAKAQDREELLRREVEDLRLRLRDLESLRAELEQLRDALQESETRFQAVTTIPEYAIISMTSQNHITFWNPGAERIFGYCAEEAHGRPLSMMIPEMVNRSSLFVREAHAAHAPTAHGRALELRGVRKNGDEFPVEVSLSSWTSKGETLFSAIVRDISYRKNALRMLELKFAEVGQKTEDLESLIQAVAHDLKSPVIAISGLVRQLQKRADSSSPDSRREKLLNQIACGAETIERFLKDLLDGLSLSRSGEDWSLVRLDSTISEVVHRHEHEIAEHGITVEIGMDDALPAIMGNKHRLAQVVDNLLVNALVHMGPRPNPAIRIECRCEKGFVLTSVSDNGTGIVREHQTRIFERFFRSPSGAGTKTGSGLGLFIAKQIVESHKGRIWVESEEGKGATFVFTLPVRPTIEGADYQI